MMTRSPVLPAAMVFWALAALIALFLLGGSGRSAVSTKIP
jgi:hypothetical protein